MQPVIIVSHILPVSHRHQRILASPLIISGTDILVVKCFSFLQNGHRSCLAGTCLCELICQIALIIVDHLTVNPAQIARHQFKCIVLIEIIRNSMGGVNVSFRHPDVPTPHDFVVGIAHCKHGIGLLEIIWVDTESQIFLIIR